MKDSNKVTRIDLGDFIHRILNKKFIIDTSQAKKNERLFSILPGIGYGKLTGFSIGVANNLSFYTSKSKNANISTINFIPEYWQNKQFTPTFFANIWSDKNKFKLVVDWRYYKYSIKDYGLGNNTTESIFNNYKYQFIRLRQSFLKAVAPDLLVGFGYSLDDHFKIANTDTIAKTNAANLNVASKSISSGISLNILFDTRRNENSPHAKGWYINMLCTQNIKALKSTSNYNSVYFDLRHYIAFPNNSKSILAIWNLNWFTFGNKVPYFDLPSTLWDTYNHAGRTYIQGRFRGRNMIYCEAEYRFNILNNELLGAAIFTNIQSFTQSNTADFSKILPGYGASLRLLVNKKSRVYFVLSYGAGVGGARAFLFNLGEMF